MSKDLENLPAAASGEFSLGGELPVRRLGFGAMRITGEGSGVHLRTPLPRLPFFAVPWSWASTS
jgi:hypothetical protein